MSALGIDPGRITGYPENNPKWTMAVLPEPCPVTQSEGAGAGVGVSHDAG
jgi:hypothetical protein